MFWLLWGSNIPGDQVIYPWKGVKFDPQSNQNIYALPRIDHLIAGDVRIVERLDDGLGLRAPRSVDGVGEDERRGEAPGGVLAHVHSELLLEELVDLPHQRLALGQVQRKR